MSLIFGKRDPEGQWLAQMGTKKLDLWSMECFLLGKVKLLLHFPAMWVTWLTSGPRFKQEKGIDLEQDNKSWLAKHMFFNSWFKGIELPVLQRHLTRLD